MLGLISKGIVIGVLVSAPMGPIGMLCIQRTLNKGRWHGFVTGLGAALSDVIYAAPAWEWELSSTSWKPTRHRSN